MSETKERKHRFGDRHDGHKIRSLPPMCYVAVFVMKDRNDACNLFSSSVDCDYIEQYIHKKREEGLDGFGFMHVLVAAYVRLVSQKPGINRYISGQRIFSRDEIILSMMVKKGLKLNSQETAIKVRFSPEDTVYDVYRKMNEQIEIAKAEGDTTNLDNVARALVKMPSVIFRGFVGLAKLLDYFGLLPKVLEEASPFHASLFVSNLGSLGIPPVFHHIYNFGNVPVFITFGAKHKEAKILENGEVTSHNVIDYTVVSDERITDGHYLASAFKMLDKLMRAPDKLDIPPEKVEQDVD